jgi:uncharacterized membrane protein YcjF (UPF0283 family)
VNLEKLKHADDQVTFLILILFLIIMVLEIADMVILANIRKEGKNDETSIPEGRQEQTTEKVSEKIRQESGKEDLRGGSRQSEAGEET